jgi:hypothetical protein
MLANYENVRIHNAHCMAHCGHNGVSHAYGKGDDPWIVDPDKKRAGGNCLLFFFLESLSALVRANYDTVAPNKEFPKCVEGSQTRWYSYARVATWLLAHHEVLVDAIAKNVGSKRSQLSDSWWSLWKTCSTNAEFVKL